MVNGLWGVGAEAIAINGHRLTSTAAIRFAGQAIIVNFRPITPPYVITVLGDAARMQQLFEPSFAGVYLAQLHDQFGITSDLAASDRLTVPGDSVTRLTAARRMQGGAAPATRLGDHRRRTWIEQPPPVRVPSPPKRTSQTSPPEPPDDRMRRHQRSHFVIPALGLLLGLTIGLLLDPAVPVWLQPYLPIAVIAALDAVFGAVRAVLDGIFNDKVFVVSFLSNVVVAAFIVFLGDQLGVGAQLSTGSSSCSACGSSPTSPRSAVISSRPDMARRKGRKSQRLQEGAATAPDRAPPRGASRTRPLRPTRPLGRPRAPAEKAHRDTGRDSDRARRPVETAAETAPSRTPRLQQTSSRLETRTPEPRVSEGAVQDGLDARAEAEPSERRDRREPVRGRGRAGARLGETRTRGPRTSESPNREVRAGGGRPPSSPGRPRWIRPCRPAPLPSTRRRLSSSQPSHSARLPLSCPEASPAAYGPEA